MGSTLFAFFSPPLHWVSAAASGLPLVSACRAALWLRYSGFSLRELLCRALALGHTGLVAVALMSQSTGSIVVAHRLSCPAARGIFPDKGLNPCPPASAARFLSIGTQRKPSLVVLRDNLCRVSST